MNLSHMIDGEGRTIRPDQAPLHAALKAASSIDRYVDFAIRHLGHVAVFNHGRNHRVRLSEKSATDIAVARLMDEVDAVIRTPGIGHGRQISYRRMIVPLVTQSGRRLLATGTLLDQRINLRSESELIH